MKVRRFELEHRWVEIKESNPMEFRTHLNSTWYSSSGVFIETCDTYVRSAWKEVFQEEYAFASFDPNDLQTSKPCCGGGIGVQSIYSGSKWHDADCDSLKSPVSPVQEEPPSSWYRTPKQAACECGAGKTSNPNCHATYCPSYVK